MKARVAFVAPLLLMVGACVTADFKAAQSFPSTPATRNAIVQHVRESLKDPYSIRDAEISNSWQTEEGLRLYGPSYAAVCIKMNGKNSYGAYTGKKPFGFVLNQGKVLDSDEDSPLCNDPRRTTSWTSFPELMNIK